MGTVFPDADDLCIHSNLNTNAIIDKELS